MCVNKCALYFFSDVDIGYWCCMGIFFDVLDHNCSLTSPCNIDNYCLSKKNLKQTSHCLCPEYITFILISLSFHCVHKRQYDSVYFLIFLLSPCQKLHDTVYSYISYSVRPLHSVSVHAHANCCLEAVSLNSSGTSGNQYNSNKIICIIQHFLLRQIYKMKYNPI